MHHFPESLSRLPRLRLFPLKRLLERRRTRDNVDKLVGNDSLATTVVLQLQRANHVVGVTRSIVHGRTTSRHLRDVTFDESGVDGVGERKLCQILGDILFLLVSLEARGVGQGLLVGNRQRGSLVSDRRDVLVVDDLDLVPLASLGGDLIGNGSRLGKRRDILANLVERDLHVIGDDTSQLSLGLVTENGDLTGLRCDGLANGLGDRRVDTTAQSTVRRDGDVERLLVGRRRGVGLLLVEVLEEL